MRRQNEYGSSGPVSDMWVQYTALSSGEQGQRLLSALCTPHMLSNMQLVLQLTASASYAEAALYAQGPVTTSPSQSPRDLRCH